MKKTMDNSYFRVIVEYLSLVICRYSIIAFKYKPSDNASMQSLKLSWPFRNVVLCFSNVDTSVSVPLCYIRLSGTRLST